ncbi:MAG: EAL domain-containing protein, partial [Boseongicola sp.]
DLEIVAEGVETESQLKLLRKLDYDLVQGYLLSRPMPLEELVQGTFGIRLESPISITVGKFA